MEDTQQAALFADIERFLRASYDRARASNIDRDTTYALWNTHISLTTSEVEMLCILAAGPLRTEAIAHRLGRDPQRTREFLDALVAAGALEMHGAGYIATPAARLYCRAVRHHWKG